MSYLHFSSQVFSTGRSPSIFSQFSPLLRIIWRISTLFVPPSLGCLSPSSVNISSCWDILSICTSPTVGDIRLQCSTSLTDNFKINLSFVRIRFPSRGIFPILPNFPIYLMDTHHYARPASTDAHTIINTDPNTRLALQQFIGNPNLLSNINSWVYGGHFCRNVSSHDFPTRPLSQFQIARFLANFESPIISAKLAGQITLCCIDSGASAVLLSQGYYKMLFPSKRPHPYVGLPFRQASGDSLPIEG